jgi:hypothetical protein
MENINNILDNAKFKVNKYKNTSFYINIKKDIIKYCQQNLIIINDIEEIDNNIYNLYTLDPYKISIELCNLLFKYDKYISLLTNINNKSFTIKLNNEALINIYLLFIYNNKEIYKTITFIKNDNLLFLPPFIKLINIYNDLYDIDQFYDYNIDDKLYITQDEYLQKTITEYKQSDINVDININSIKYNLIKDIIYKLNKNDINHIKLDYYYLIELQNKFNINNTIDYNNSLNIIIDKLSDIELIKNILIHSYKKKYKFNKYDNDDDIIHIQKNNTYIIHDFRLVHYKIYLVHYNKKYKNHNHILLLNIFNSLEYEILPIIKLNNSILHSNYITHEFVIYRFIFIIVLNILFYEKKHLYKINNYINMINEINLLLNDNKLSNDMYEFIGNYRNYNFDKILYSKKFKNYPYKPLIYHKQNNSLK